MSNRQSNNPPIFTDEVKKSLTNLTTQIEQLEQQKRQTIKKRLHKINSSTSFWKIECCSNIFIHTHSTNLFVSREKADQIKQQILRKVMGSDGENVEYYKNKLQNRLTQHNINDKRYVEIQKILVQLSDDPVIVEAFLQLYNISIKVVKSSVSWDNDNGCVEYVDFNPTDVVDETDEGLIVQIKIEMVRSILSEWLDFLLA